VYGTWVSWADVTLSVCVCVCVCVCVYGTSEPWVYGSLRSYDSIGTWVYGTLRSSDSIGIEVEEKQIRGRGIYARYTAGIRGAWYSGILGSRYP